MARIRQSRSPEVSLMQSAIDVVVMRNKAAGVAESIGETIQANERVGIEDPMVHQAALLAYAVDNGKPIPDAPHENPVSTEGVGDVAVYCASIGLKLAKAIFTGDKAAEHTYRNELTARFGTCDARYVEAAEQCAVYFGAMQAAIPYVDYQQIGDFVIEDKNVLPSNAVVGIIGDWGTGQERACDVLRALATHHPDVVIHLGDIYYSGVEHETQNYFFDKWCSCLGLGVDGRTRNVLPGKPRTFSLAGNHDMYSGGAPYYKMIRQLGQSASFFCLRNDNWQFVGLDTGYNDHDLTPHFTQLPPRQGDWLKDKVDTRGQRKTVLLSHHQLFSSAESFQNGCDTNTALLSDVHTVLQNVDLWLWGHEHDLVIFKEYKNLRRGRCVGHGAYPVGFAEIPNPPKRPDIREVNTLLPRGQSFYNNGYAVMTLSGTSAHVVYCSIDDNSQESAFFEEDI